MSNPLLTCSGFFLAIALTSQSGHAATIVAGPNEAGFRAAIAAALPGDIVLLTNRVELEATVRIDKPLTVRYDPSEAWRYAISGDFDGVLLQLVGEGIVLESIRFNGSPQTDALDVALAVGDVIVRDSAIANCRQPVLDHFWVSEANVRLERVNASWNLRGLECFRLDARESTFSYNGGLGVGAYYASLDRCRIENNLGDGMILINGAVRNSSFRFNAGLGMRFDPDPGTLILSGCLFYANAGGGLLLREEAYATVDNCTFTRHTGLPAVLVTEAHDVLFRHCTIADNVFIAPDHWGYQAGAAFIIEQSGRVELQNCLVADNPTNGAPHSAGLVTPYGDWIDGGGNVIGGPARLGVLSDNGGPTLSLMPLPDSPAIDAGQLSVLVVDARGLSRLSGTAPDAGAIEVGAAPPTDADADGLPDVWEQFRGLNPNDSTDAASDTDGDGRSALAEYRSGTDPADPQSVHRVTQLTIYAPPALQPELRPGYLTWPVTRGVTYAIEISTDLRDWRRVVAPWFSYYRENGLLMRRFDIEADAPQAFYRVTAE